MKTPYIIAAVLAVSSCLGLPSEDSPMGEAVFSVREETKAVPGVSETAISHWSVMLFDTGNPAACYWGSSDSGADITCVARKGRSYRAYAIANYPKDGPGTFDPSMVSTEEELRAFTSLLHGNSPSGLTMFGWETLTQLPTARTPIGLTRLCSKVCIQKITLDVTDPVYAGEEFILNALYLTNVYCAGTFWADHTTPSSDAALWYNAGGWHGSGSIDALDALIGDRGLSQSITNGGSYTVTHSFYAYPNAVATDSRSATWSPRCTRLVIEATFGGKRYYYPVTISDMKRNHNYIVSEAIIHGPGSRDPEEEIPGVIDVTLSITPNIWDSEYYISEAS